MLGGEASGMDKSGGMPCKSKGAQASATRTISHVGGSGCMLPQENFEFLISKECMLLRHSDSSLRFLFIV